jgi:hypothetical protein
MKEQMTHPDSGVLAEFSAGLITGRHAAQISAHLAACERCTGLCDELAELPALLAAVPAPVMPDTVLQRLENVLAAEADNRDSSERAGDDGAPDRVAGPLPRRTAGPGHRRHRDFRLVALRVLAPAAAVLVLAAGGYGLSRIAGGSTNSIASSSSASSRSAESRAVPAAAGEAVPSGTTTNRSEGSPAIEAPITSGVVISGTDYRRATLVPQLEGELRLHPRAPGTAQELTPASLQGCVLRVTRDPLLLVEQARFQGQPAIVIVAVTGRHDTAWLTTSACSAASDHVLATTTLPGTSAS